MARTVAAASLAAVAVAAVVLALAPRHEPRRVAEQRSSCGRTVRVDDAWALTTGGGSLWLLVREAAAGALVRVDPARGTVTGRVRLDFAPWELAYGARSVWVVGDGGVLAQVDPVGLRVQDRVRDRRFGLAVAATNHGVWVGGSEAFLHTVFTLEPGGRPRAVDVGRATVMSLHARDDTVWSAGAVAALELDPRGRIVTRVPARLATSVAFAGPRVWIGSRTPTGGRLIPAGAATGGRAVRTSVTPFAVAAEGDTLWVAQKFEGGSPLQRVDTETRRVREIGLPGNVLDVAVAGGRVWVALPDRLVELCRAAAGADAASPAAAELRAIDTSAGPSPVARCRGGAGRVFVRSEVEPFIAAEPGHPRRLVGVYQQDRFADGQARAIGLVTSRDSGRTWKRSLLPFSHCASSAPDFARAGDPWVSIGPDGTAYAIAAGNGIVAGSSHDGWRSPVVIQRPARRTFLDKPSITVDPRRAGTAYAVWVRWLHVRGGPPVIYDALFARTDDHGRTWSQPDVIVEHTQTGGAVSSQVLVDRRRGTLYHPANFEDGGLPSLATPARIIVQRSEDGGETWSEPATVAEVRTRGYRPLGSSNVFVRTGVEAADFALDPRSGAIYAVWQDARFSGFRFDSVALSRSLDGGRTWSAARRVDDAGDATAAVPSVAADDQGRVAISYYVLRAAGDVARAQFAVALSDDRGDSFSQAVRTAETSLAEAPKVQATTGITGSFLGDYVGLAGAGSGFVALYSLPSEDPADVFFASVEG